MRVLWQGPRRRWVRRGGSGIGVRQRGGGVARAPARRWHVAPAGTGSASRAGRAGGGACCAARRRWQRTTHATPCTHAHARGPCMQDAPQHHRCTMPAVPLSPAAPLCPPARTTASAHQPAPAATAPCHAYSAPVLSPFPGPPRLPPATGTLCPPSITRRPSRAFKTPLFAVQGQTTKPNHK